MKLVTHDAATIMTQIESVTNFMTHCTQTFRKIVA